jgi:hypothetical protein
MSIDHISTPTGVRPLPNGDPATWVYLDDLVLPPEQQREVEKEVRRFWWWQRRVLRGDIELREKFRHFFPGKDVAFRKATRGYLILMVGDFYSPEFAAFLDGLPRPERCQVLIDSVPDPQDDTTII